MYLLSQTWLFLVAMFDFRGVVGHDFSHGSYDDWNLKSWSWRGLIEKNQGEDVRGFKLNIHPKNFPEI